MLKKAALFVCLACFAVGLVHSADTNYPKGRVIESAIMPSKILGHDIQYTVYLPPDYDASKRTYPIFYLMHGGGDDDTAWVHLGEIAHIMDQGIAEGRITPMIVVTPDGRRKFKTRPRAYFMNDADGNYSWADMFFQEFMPFVEKEFRVRQWMEARAIGGLSMGAYAALAYTFQNPGMFSATVALSAGIYTEEQVIEFSQQDYDERYGPAFGAVGKEGKDRITEHYYTKHPLGIMKSLKPEDWKKMKLFLDCGAEDRFDEGYAELHSYLKKAGVPHYYTIRPGEHVWDFWRTGIVKGMEFATAAFHH